MEIENYRMSGFGSSNSHEITLEGFGLSLLHRSGQKGRTDGFDQSLGRQERYDVRKCIVVFAGPRLDRGAADCIPEDAKMASLVITDLGNRSKVVFG